MNAERLLAHYHRIAAAPDAIARLRRFILDLAVRGKLVPQNPDDEPASELLKRIAKEKARLVRVGEIRADKPLAPVSDDRDFDVPSTWQWTRLGVVTSYIQRGKSPKYAVSEGSPVVSQKCVQWRGLDLTVAKQITLKSLADYEDVRFLRDGDLLWNSTGTGTIGRVIRLVDTPERLVCDSHVTVVRCLIVDPEFVRTWIRSDHVYGLIEDRAAGSTNQVELTAQMANNQVVPLPPLDEQRRIVAKVDELFDLCDRLETTEARREIARDRLAAASLARLTVSDREIFQTDTRFALDALPTLTTRPDQIKQLRQTILNLAVRGKLVPQDPNDEPASALLRRIEFDAGSTVQATSYPVATGWKWTHIEDCFVVSGGMQKTPARTPKFNAFPYLSVGNVYRGRLELANVKKFELADGELERFRLEPSDILVVEGNGSATEIGRCAVWHGEIENCVHQNHLIRCRPKELLLTPYTALYLNSPDGMAEMKRLAITSAGLFSLSVGKIRKIPFPLPPLAEQHRIVAKVDALMALCDRLEANLTVTAATRRRLLDALLAEALAPAESREREAAE